VVNVAAHSYDPSEVSTTVEHIRSAQNSATPVRVPAPPRRSRTERIRIALSGALAAVLGLLPHVLHHAGPLAGAALVAGVGGSLLFGALGFLASIPLLLRLHRRSGGWRVPAAALALFVAIFSISTFVIGPAITGNDSGSSDSSGSQQAKPQPPRPEQPAPSSGSGHEGHH
jgi:hypothetical protein